MNLKRGITILLSGWMAVSPASLMHHRAVIADDASIRLGAPELFAGIPGTGVLTEQQISAWLDQVEVHEPLTLELPMGLDAALAGVADFEDNPITRAKIELGRQLFFDPRLSRDGTVSCATCHVPETAFAQGTAVSLGIGEQAGTRNSPTVLNRVLSGAQFWDGRAPSLEQQVLGPISNPKEMGNTLEGAVAAIRSIPGYVMQFERVFPDEGLSIATLGKSIATFERALVTGPAAYDYLELVRNLENQLDEEEIEELAEDGDELFLQYQEAKRNVAQLSEAAIRGRDLFFSSKANCTACHAGANFTDEQYHNLGVGMEGGTKDFGRAEVTGDPKDTGAFKTPTCRNVAKTAPYMHDGSQATLRDVVEWYDKGGHANPFLSDKMKVLGLTDQEKQDLVAFLEEGLQGTVPEVERGRLPPSGDR